MKRKVLVVHRHENSEGSTILAVVAATPKGKKHAEAVKDREEHRTGFMSCDVVEIEEYEIEEET